MADPRPTEDINVVSLVPIVAAEDLKQVFPAPAAAQLAAKQLPPGILIDCSHGNSRKDFTRQEAVLEAVLGQLRDRCGGVFGFMLESFLEAGNQPLQSLASGGLTYGQSITDACLDWETTERLLLHAHASLP